MKIKKVLTHPFSFLGNGLERGKKGFQRDLETLAEMKRLAGDKPAQKHMIDSMVDDKIDPRRLISMIKSARNKSYFFLGMMIVPLIVAGANDSILYKVSALIYFLLFGFIFFVMQCKSYRLMKMADVSFKEFLSANDHQFFGKLKFGKKKLIAIFEAHGNSQGEYARNKLNKKA